MVTSKAQSTLNYIIGAWGVLLPRGKLEIRGEGSGRMTANMAREEPVSCVLEIFPNPLLFPKLFLFYALN